MFRIEKSEQLAEKICQMWIRAPHVAHHAQAGQFVILRIDEKGERIPLTISAVDGDAIRIIFMAVGKTTNHLAAFHAGDHIQDVAGPLGKPSETHKFGTCVLVGGGVGTASLPIIARALKASGNRVIGIVGARNKSLLLLEDEMGKACDELLISTDDGSKGFHGFAADLLKQVMAREPVHAVWIIGPAMMMKVTCEVTRPAGIRTFVSLNPVMVDGTGMCGSCRVIVDGATKFACVDGPEFDAHKVDFNGLMQRLRTYQPEEKESLEKYQAHLCACGGGDHHA
ncbi:sulfide/dihydroorotate dehydrogenase-like FAD/NAD-binding protein [Methanoregula sp.]|uniref:sulfide/dihydroorotate dehydrogenase-like FAD/NAD-binding protein n=1 Tax=Methanoregula sp. TaxID=2052170 RepID=UPI003C78EE97